MFVSLKDADNISHHMQTDTLPSGEEAQAVKLKLGDALIAATALVYDLVIVTRNTKDFQNIAGLEYLNPHELG